MAYYSQNGEDFILDEIFKNKKEGFFVEVGCIDGKRFSNTLFFEEKGWKGICVEAHQGFRKLLLENRPGSVIVNAAVGEKDEETTFYANSRGSLSTLDKSKEKYFKERYKNYFEGFEEQIVFKYTLDTIFSKEEVNEIDIMSIDIEGYELQALSGLTIDRWAPKVFVIEADTFEDEVATDKVVLPHGYVKLCKLINNVFYIRKDLDPPRLKSDYIDIKLTHTSHPVDKKSFTKIVKTHVKLDLPVRRNEGTLKKLIKNILGKR